MTDKMTLEGVARTLTPLMIADPASNARTDIDGKIGFSGGGFPITLTRQIVLHHTGQRYPIVPGNTVRGALRRHCADIIEETLADKDLQLSLPVYQAMRCGAAAGSPDKIRAVSLSGERALRGHIFAGLFGGGPRLQASRLVTDNWMPICEGTIDAGIVDSCYGKAAGEAGDSGLSMTAVQWIRRNDDVLQFCDPKAEEVIKVYPDAVDQWQQIYAQPKKSDDSNAETGNSESADGESDGSVESARGVTGFNAHQVVIPTTAFYTRTDVEPKTEAQAGLFLEGMSRLMNAQIGSYKRCGYGRLSYDLELCFDGQRIKPFTFDEAGRCVPDRGQETVARFLDAAEAECEAFDVREFEAIYAPDKEAQQKIVKDHGFEGRSAW